MPAVVTPEPLCTDAQSAAPARSSSRPQWLPTFIPAFDGLRGIAIVAVLLYHCHKLLEGTFVEKFIVWGWTGVSLFFVLSGFLITGIILDARPGPGFYENFFRRRALRIWPAYWLLLFLFYFFFPFVFSGYRYMLGEIARAPWLYLLVFVQNLWPIALPGSLGPTWSLAIEQQFYLFWAPVARQLPPRWLLAASVGMMAVSPAVRVFYGHRLTPTHTLIHLDGLAIGAMIAIALRLFAWTPAVWRWIARGGFVIGGCGVALMLYRGSALTDSLLAFGFGGMLIWALLGHATAQPSLYCRILGFRPLAFLGKISYGLYLIHILVFSVMWSYVDKPLQHFGLPGNVAIVAIRLAVAISCAALMWRYFEQPILARKR